MTSEAELMSELESLKTDMSTLLDKPMDSPEVKAWVSRMLAIKSELNRVVH
ncbi:hypothetical protein [Shewanella sp. 11B5]|uniref:hypothetical protein n=1 Tax=Shewanella sp. 11B5 TaxID=2058298 RepID=UPI0015E0C25C|nr:hypothetical protein [Shewanella sp. 11B5]